MSQETANIVTLFFEQARLNPSRLAIADSKADITFGELAQRIKARAQQLQEKGLQSGDRVLLFVPMSTGLYIDCLAIFTLGATAVFLDEWVNIKRLDLCCKIADCRAFVAPLKLRLPGTLLSSAIRKIPLKIGVKRSETGGDELKPVSLNSDNETALITFTTGSTGTPKAAKRTHAFLKEQFDALMEKVNPQEGEIDMPALPIVLMINLACGTPSVIPDWKASRPTSMDAHKIWRQIETHKVNRITASPYFLERLSGFIIEKGHSTKGFTKLFTGGAPVFPPQAKKYADAFPKCKVNIIYGSTEAEPISSITAQALLQEQDKAASFGLPVGDIHPTTEVRIIEWRDETLDIDQSGLDKITLPNGSVGEIIVAGPHVLREYFNNEEALLRNKIFIGDKCWHRTGDSGRLNEAGQLHLLGRCAQIIEHEGKSYYPFLIENQLAMIDGITIGTMIQESGGLTIILEAQPNASQHQIREAVKQLKLPAALRITRSIPRDKRHHSKIDYAQLES